MSVERRIFKKYQTTLWFTFLLRPGIGLSKTAVSFYCDILWAKKTKTPPQKKVQECFFLRELFFDKIKKIGPVYSFNARILISMKFNISRVEKALRGQAAPL